MKSHFFEQVPQFAHVKLACMDGSLDTSDYVSSGDILGHLIHLIMFRLVIYWVT